MGEGKYHTLGKEVKTRWSEFEVVRVGKKDVLIFASVGGGGFVGFRGRWRLGCTCELVRAEQRTVLMMGVVARWTRRE